MTTTASGIPRVKALRRHRAKPLEATVKHTDPRKKVKEKDKEEIDNQDDLINGWRKKK